MSLRRALLLASCLLPLACREDDTHGTVPTASGDYLCDAPEVACDIDERDCQQTILEVTACIHGDRTPAPPEVRSISPDDFRGELQARADELGLRTTPWETAFSALGLLPPEMDVVDTAIEETVTSVAAYYSHQTKDVTIIESPKYAPIDRNYVLSHELTHYLQDRKHDLGALREELAGTTDQNNALLSVIEGDAVVTSTRAMVRVLGGSAEELDWDTYFDAMLMRMLQSIPQSAAPLHTAQQSLPYPLGGLYVARAWEEGRAAVDGLFREPPRALADVLDGYGAQGSLVQPLDCAPPLPPPGFVLYGLDSLGAPAVLGLLALSGSLTDGDVSLASALRGDLIAVYAQSDAKDAPASPARVAWRLRMSSPAQAARLEGELLIAGLRGVRQQEAELLITASDDGAAAFDGAALASCPTVAELSPSGPADPSNVAALRRLLAPAGGFEPP